MSRGIDDTTDARLYELWIQLELLHMLDGLHAIEPTTIQIERDQIRFRFLWSGRNFFFTYNRQPSEGNEMVPSWKNIPATKARFLIERDHPLEVQPQDIIIWREPPVILDVSYESTNSSHGNDYITRLQQMVGEMRLRGIHHAALFAPTLSEPSQGERYTKAHRDDSVYTEGMSYNLKDTVIRLCTLTPGMDIGILQDRLKMLLDDVTSKEVLPERSEPACHGIILDEDTINDGRSRPVSYNILCPKPHIGEGVFDLVNDKVHCLKDPRICHIYGQAKIPPFVIRASTRDAMQHQSSGIRNRADEALKQAEKNGEDNKAEQLRSHIFLGVGRTVEQYVKLRGNTALIEASFEEWIFGKYWKSHSRCLAEETRNILLSGTYVWNEYQQTTLSDWAAPAIQYCRALETEMKRRLHDYYPDPKHHYPDISKKGFNVPSGNMTLGAVETIYKLKDRHAKDTNEANRIGMARHNWSLCCAIVTYSRADIATFETILKQMVDGHVSHNRNELAHAGPISEKIAQQLRDTIIGCRDKVGILYRLVECLEPKV